MTDYYVDNIGGLSSEPHGRFPSPDDLAGNLADVLSMAETRGLPRPSFEVRAEEDGKERPLTTEERKALDAALDRSLADLRHSALLARRRMEADGPD